jgi:pyrimidine deaminase RibD-like protein
MQSKDFVKFDRELLDACLVGLCGRVIDGLEIDSEKHGLVGACIIDPYDNRAYGTSTHLDGGLWDHAERTAIEKYHAKYGKIPEGSIIVTTLSPCDSHMKDRYKSSCTDLIASTPVNQVYCGYKDPTQDNDRFEFKVSYTANKDIEKLCKKFADEIFKKQGLIQK